MKKFLSLIFVLTLIVSLFTGCKKDEGTYVLNGREISEYTIIYSATDPDYTQRAATYLSDQIAAKTGLRLDVKSDAEQAEPLAHEILVGETNRAISASLDAETEGFQFSMLADENHIAMEGDYFVIAAAAYYFMENFVKNAPFKSAVAQKPAVYEPIVKEAKNFAFLIGDGMGVGQTKLFDEIAPEDLDLITDGESEFYGYMFPHQGFSITWSLTGTTDSAAGGTALATGYKTMNYHVGRDEELNDVTSLTEIAIELGKATAVISTESLDGATPASFSAHADDREDSDVILACQEKLAQDHGTIFLGGYHDNYDAETLKQVESELTETLNTLSQDEDGFFIMYEEAYIDKHSHDNEMGLTFSAVTRFNQIVGTFMEYAFYNPDTFVLITADHETGGLGMGMNDTYIYTTKNHTSADVPIFAYGMGAEVFDGKTVENIQIPKTIAHLWGVELEGYDNESYPALLPNKQN